MNDEKDSAGQIEQDEKKRPNDCRIDEDHEQPAPPFLNEGPEMVRDSHC